MPATLGLASTILCCDLEIALREKANVYMVMTFPYEVLLSELLSSALKPLCPAFITVLGGKISLI